jgi:pyrimidine deaminase RibD-like protein
MAKHAKILEKATKLASKSRCRYALGAVIVRRGRIVSSSANVLMRPTTEANFRWATMHAEESALQGLQETKGRYPVCFPSREAWGY